MLFEPDHVQHAPWTAEEMENLRSKLETAARTIRKLKDDAAAFAMERELLHETVNLLRNELEKEVRKSTELEMAVRRMQETVARQRPGGTPSDPTSPRGGLVGSRGVPPSPIRGIPGQLPASPRSMESDSDNDAGKPGQQLRAELETANRERAMLRERVLSLQDADNAMRRELFDSNRRIADLADRLDATKVELERSRTQLKKVGDLVQHANGAAPQPPPAAPPAPPPPIPSQQSPTRAPQVVRRETVGYAPPRGPQYPSSAAAAAQSAAQVGYRFHASHEEVQTQQQQQQQQGQGQGQAQGHATPAARVEWPPGQREARTPGEAPQQTQSSRDLREAASGAAASAPASAAGSLRGGSFEDSTGLYNGRPVRVRQSVSSMIQHSSPAPTAPPVAPGPAPPPPPADLPPRHRPAPDYTSPRAASPSTPARPSSPARHAAAAAAVVRTPPGAPQPPPARPESPAASVSSRATTEQGEELPITQPGHTRFLYNADPQPPARRDEAPLSPQGTLRGAPPVVNGFATDPTPHAGPRAMDRERHVPPYQPPAPRTSFVTGRPSGQLYEDAARREAQPYYSERDLRGAADREREREATSARGPGPDLAAHFGHGQPLAQPPAAHAYPAAPLRTSYQSLPPGLLSGAAPPAGPSEAYGGYRPGQPPTPQSGPYRPPPYPHQERELASTPGGARVLAPTPILATAGQGRAPSVSRHDGRNSAAFDPNNYFKPITGPEDEERPVDMMPAPAPAMPTGSQLYATGSTSLPLHAPSASGFNSARGSFPSRPVPLAPPPAPQQPPQPPRATPAATRSLITTPVMDVARPLSRPVGVPPLAPVRMCNRCGLTFNPNDRSAVCEKSSYHPGPTETVPHKQGGFAELYVCCNRVFHIVGGGDDKWIRVAGCRTQGHI